MYQRNLKPKLQTALSDTPVVMLCGARQTGKSTLALALKSKHYSPEYITFDDFNQLQAATHDPVGFVSNLPEHVILDEVQHAQSIFRTIKHSVDKNRKPGRFLLTGSANVMVLPKISESLAGRMEILTLWPLSQQELEGRSTDIITQLFELKLPRNLPHVSRSALMERIFKGGYPEILSRSGARRADWFLSYIRAILEKDIRDIAEISDITRFPRLMSYLASQCSTLLNLSNLSNAVDIPYATLHRYMTYLEATYLCVSVPAWSSNLGLRLVKSKKLLLNDTGLLTSLLGMSQEALEKNPALLGAVVENFVGMELLKLLGQSETRAQLFHFRTAARQEIDYLLERQDGQLLGIEVKATSTLKGDEFDALKGLAEKAGQRFSLGVLLYGGESVVRIDERLVALPISALWAL